MSTRLTDLDTPALVLDKARLAANAKAMTARVSALGVDLRPHLKTAKSADVARVATDGNFGGVTVSTLAEAEYFLEHGIPDTIYAVCISPAKLDRAAALRERGAELKILTDNPDTARAIAAHPGSHRVLIEIDCGEHRTGVESESDALIEIAETIAASPRSEVAGVLTHAGHSYNCRSREEMAALAEVEREAVVGAAHNLRQAGVVCPIVSVGSTPTATFARDLTGVTEARPGVYVFYDLFQAGIGVCGIDDIALSVLASVIAHRPEKNELMIDAGGLALSKDRSTGALDHDCGFGLVCAAETGRPIGDMKVAGVHQEHGLVHATAPLPYEDLPIGARVRVLPNHACMTAAAYPAYHVVDGTADDAGAVVATWARCNGW